MLVLDCSTHTSLLFLKTKDSWIEFLMETAQDKMDL